jgi:hypothetical protein
MLVVRMRDQIVMGKTRVPVTIGSQEMRRATLDAPMVPYHLDPTPALAPRRVALGWPGHGVTPPAESVSGLCASTSGL